MRNDLTPVGDCHLVGCGVERLRYRREIVVIERKYVWTLPGLGGDLPLLAVGQPHLGLNSADFFQFVGHVSCEMISV